MKAKDYIVVPRSVIIDRKEFCEKYIKERNLEVYDEDYVRLKSEIDSYDFILSESKELEPLLSDAYEEGWMDNWGGDDKWLEEYLNREI